MFSGGNSMYVFQAYISGGNSKCLQGGWLVVDVFRRVNTECFHES